MRSLLAARKRPYKVASRFRVLTSSWGLRYIVWHFMAVILLIYTKSKYSSNRPQQQQFGSYGRSARFNCCSIEDTRKHENPRTKSYGRTNTNFLSEALYAQPGSEGGYCWEKVCHTPPVAVPRIAHCRSTFGDKYGCVSLMSDEVLVAGATTPTAVRHFQQSLSCFSVSSSVGRLV